MARPQEIVEDVMQTTAGSIKQLSPLQQAGVALLIAVGSVVALVIIFLAVDFALHTPNTPNVNVTADTVDFIDKTMATYESASKILLDRTTNLFELIVVKALLPVFTTILGYVFGTSNKERD